MKYVLLTLLALLTALTTAIAAPVAEADIPVRYTAWEIGYDVNSDGSYVETQKWSAVVLKESAIEGSKQGSVTFSTSVAKGEILEAYTLKKSGKRIDAPKNSYQVTTNDGYNSASPLYSDETTISVIFPDLAVGDTTVFAYRVSNSEGIFPGQFSAVHYFSRFSAYDDVRIRVSSPAAMKLRHEAYFLTALPTVEKDGRRVMQWSFRNSTPEKWTPAESGIPVVGDSASLYLSTFDSYRQIAESYGSRATPKAAVTGRVKELAAKIVPDKGAPESQARAIYDWVARNITYGGNCIGVGAVVPRDLDVVLDNRQGDCKDHATLLQALLSARGIASEQALVNAGGQFDLSATPVVSAVNHVINYIPSLKLYVDSTASYIPFGMLPPSLGEKPVLHVTNYREGVKIPTTATYGHDQSMQTTIRIKQDGSAEGRARVSLKGTPAVAMRAVMRRVTADQEDLIARRFLESQGFHGTGKLTKDDPTELLDSYSYSIAFTVEDLQTFSGTTGMPVRPVISSPISIGSVLAGTYEPASKKQSACTGGSSIEEYTYEFPDGFSVVGVPKDFRLAGPVLHYTASYKKSGSTLSVRRELRDTTASNICSPAFMEEYRKNARAISQEVRAQVLITN